jgi:hypothetical protein
MPLEQKNKGIKHNCQIVYFLEEVDKKYICECLKISNFSYAQIIFLAGFAAEGFTMRILLFGYIEPPTTKSTFVSVQN